MGSFFSAQFFLLLNKFRVMDLFDILNYELFQLSEYKSQVCIIILVSFVKLINDNRHDLPYFIIRAIYV